MYPLLYTFNALNGQNKHTVDGQAALLIANKQSVTGSVPGSQVELYECPQTAVALVSVHKSYRTLHFASTTTAKTKDDDKEAIAVCYHGSYFLPSLGAHGK